MSYNARVTRLPPYALLDLRGDERSREVFSQTLDMRLPTQPNTMVTHAGSSASVLWLGPDQWLVKAADGHEQTLFARLTTASSGLHAAVTIVSDHYAVFQLTGIDAAAILTQGCSLDIHPSRFTVGQCARCKFARTQVILLPLIEPTAYELLVEATYAHYLTLWFEQAIGA